MKQHIIRVIKEMIIMEVLLIHYLLKKMAESKFLNSKHRMHLILVYRNLGKLMKKIKFYLKTDKYIRHKKTIVFM